MLNDNNPAVELRNTVSATQKSSSVRERVGRRREREKEGRGGEEGG